MNRSIQTAINVKTGEIVKADLIFQTQKDGQEVRKVDKQTDGDDFCCYECGQFLETTSKNKNVFFRHKKGYSFCDLTDDHLKQDELEDFVLMNKIKEESQENYIGRRSPEGERHYNLKKQIAQNLEKTKYVTKVQDEKIIRKDFKIRRADVYCEFNGKKIVFEIQFSKLSARYIFSRYNFYKENGIFLIWILDVNLKNQDQFAIDVKYLNEYENYFSIAEKSESLQLICRYKEASINEYNEMRTMWTTRILELTHLNFNEIIFQVYYYDLLIEKQKKEKIRQERIEENNKIEQQKRLEVDRKRHQIYAKWKNDWISKFRPDFQDKSQFFIKNSKGSVLLFAKDDMTREEIEYYETQIQNLIWVVNGSMISRKFELNKLLPKKLKEFNNTQAKEFQSKIGEFHVILKDFKESRIIEQNKIQNRIDIIEKKRQKLLSELNLPKTDYAKSILYFLWNKEGKINKFPEFVNEIEIDHMKGVQEYKSSKDENAKQIIENEENIKLWEDKKGFILKDMILRQKPYYEITNKELSKNKRAILVRNNLIERQTNSKNLKRLDECVLEDILASPKDYSLYDDYSIIIEEWKRKIEESKLKLTNILAKLLELQDIIENEFTKWIDNKISVLQGEIEAELNEILISNDKIVKFEKLQIDQINRLEKEKETQIKKIIEKFHSKYEFEWNSYDIAWCHSKRPVFFEIEDNLYGWRYQINNEANEIEKIKFIDFYNK